MRLCVVFLVLFHIDSNYAFSEVQDILEGFPMVLSNWTSCLADLEVKVINFKQDFENYNNRYNVENVNHYNFPGNNFGMGYNEAEQFCYFKNQILCNPADIIPVGDTMPVITGAIAGEHWAPIRFTYNDWISVGTTDTGDLYIAENGDVPPWGLADTESGVALTSVKGNIYCCPLL